jgi:hypothetical protein
MSASVTGGTSSMRDRELKIENLKKEKHLLELREQELLQCEHEFQTGRLQVIKEYWRSDKEIQRVLQDVESDSRQYQKKVQHVVEERRYSLHKQIKSEEDALDKQRLSEARNIEQGKVDRYGFVDKTR